MIKSEAKGQAVLLGEGEGDGALLLTSKKTNGDDQQRKFSYLGFCSTGPLFTVKLLNRFESPALLHWESPEMDSRGAGIIWAWLVFTCTLTRCAPSPTPAFWVTLPSFLSFPPRAAITKLFHLHGQTCKPSLGLGTAIPGCFETPNHPTEGIPALGWQWFWG